MADVYEKDLAQKSSLTTSDFIRVVGSDNVSYKQLVSDVAKKIIETYTGSTLAGSARSIQTAFSATVAGKGTLTSIASDTVIINKEPGMYQVQLSADSSYLPSRYGLLTIDFNSNYGVATFYLTNGDTYRRVFSRNNNSWYGAWTKLPTRAEIDALNSNLTVKDIKSKLSSSVATIQAAYSQRIGNVVIVQLRFTLTSAVAPHTDVISGFDRSNSNYSGINSFSLYDNTAEEFFGAQVTHLDGSTTESLRTLSSLASGHNIRGTFMYIAA